MRLTAAVPTFSGFDRLFLGAAVPLFDPRASRATKPATSAIGQLNVVLGASSLTPRRAIAASLMAALLLSVSKLPASAQFTPTLTSVSSVPGVTGASTGLQTAIQTGGNVAAALSAYNSAVMSAAEAIGNDFSAPTMVSVSVSVGSNLAAPIFAAPGGALAFNGTRVSNSGGFFLGTNNSSPSAFLFTGNSATTQGGAIVNALGTAKIDIPTSLW